MRVMRSPTEKTELYAIRLKLGMSQVQLAEHLQVNIATIWRWENDGVPAKGAARGIINRLAKEAAAKAVAA